MAVNPEVARVIKEFHAAGKPMALCCIAPILAAKVLGSNVSRLGVKPKTTTYNHIHVCMYIIHIARVNVTFFNFCLSAP